jgi:hypothetical protein
MLASPDMGSSGKIQDFVFIRNLSPSHEFKLYRTGDCQAWRCFFTQVMRFDHFPE